MKIAAKKVEATPATPRVGSRSFEANVTFHFIQAGKRITAAIEVQVPASNMLGALGRAGRLAMPLLRKEYPDGKIKLKEVTVEIAQV